MDAIDNERNTESHEVEAVTLENGGIYTGELASGKPEGIGKCIIEVVNMKAILRMEKNTAKV